MDVPARTRVASGSVDIPGTSSSMASTSISSRPRRERERSGRHRDRHVLALRSIRDFLRGRSSYDVLPVSFRLIVLDTKLVVKPALDVMWQAGVVSAPLWQSTPPSFLGDSSNTTQTSPPVAPSAIGSEPPMSPKSGAEELKSKAQKKAEVKAHQLSGFAGMLTVNDIIHLIQYYYHHSSYDSAAEDVEKFRLERLRDIEQALNVPPPPLLSVHPLRPLFDACQLLIKTHARRLPLLDYDEQTGMETVVSVLTQYRVLKFIAMNCRETAALWRSLRQLGIGTYCHSIKVGPAATPRGSASAGSSHRGSDASAGEPALVKSDGAHSSIATEHSLPQSTADPALPEAAVATSAEEVASAFETETGNPFAPLATATLDTTVFDVVHMFSEQGISAVPILDEDGNVVDMYETVDVITLVRTGAYTALDLTIRQALERRPPDFSGVWTCSPDDSLASIFALLRKRRVHRLLVLEPQGPASADTDSKPSDPMTPFEDLDSYAEDLIEDEKKRERARTQSFINDAGAPLDDRLEKGDPVRKVRGKLVGMVCLSDILRYVIGDPSGERGAAGGVGAGGRRSASGAMRRESSSAASRSRGTSITSSVASTPPPTTTAQPQSSSSAAAAPTTAVTAAAAPAPPVHLSTPTTEHIGAPPSSADPTAHTITSSSTHLDATRTIPEEEVLPVDT